MTEVKTFPLADEDKWNAIVEQLKAQFGKKPDLQSIIFLIGHRELGTARSTFTKEEKQDLMHVGVCKLLSQAGYYQFVSNDADGWPHYELVPRKPRLNPEEQEALLKAMVIEYFENL